VNLSASGLDERALFRVLLFALLALAAVIALALGFIAAPYGRHGRSTRGPRVDARLGWLLMESPAALVFGLLMLLGPRPLDGPMVAFLLLWEAHYLHRAFIYPFRLRASRMPLAIVAGGLLFTTVNGYLNGRWLSALSPAYPADWLRDPRFLVGVALFVTGFAINFHADRVLLHLRRPGETGYKVPRGGLYRYVTCPNYLGEIIEWSGWALATWSLPGLTFALWTIANLAPRARTHHKWYRAQFPDYPPERRALIPFAF
jgi:steroid 5-alpha-reductase/3-oxo-5-alpha-steroid 4-dehydrogenase 1